MFTSVFIDDYCNFRSFKLDIPAKNEDSLNLNILIGKNGSGKSCFLDALYCIAKNNLNSKVDKKVDNTEFDYKILLNNKTIIENPKTSSSNYLPDDEIKNHLWDKVLRLYTGPTDRMFNKSDNYNVMSLGPDEAKWALLTTFLAGQWTSPTAEVETLWNKVQQIVLGFNPNNMDENLQQIKPKIVWVELADVVEAGEKSIFADDFYDWRITYPHSRYIKTENGCRYFWDIDECEKLPESDDEYECISMFEILKHLIELRDEGKIFDTGFLYTQDGENLLPSEYLSDGEFGLLARFAVMMICRDIKGKALVLLDEPETHFNEYWKTWFLQLVCETLEKTKHDVFIATHSAMLLTDAKENELLRLEAAPDGIRQRDVMLTFGANIVDIGKVLFQMESDIGERSKQDLENLLNGIDPETHKEFKNNSKYKQALQNKLRSVGPGEWRWRIRSKINQLEKADLCCNFEKRI